jgi:predicted transcriptional regulator
MLKSDRKQREGLVVALYEKNKTYREIARELRISFTSIKAILNRAGLDQSTTLTSHAYELFSKDKTPLEVAITLNIAADEAIKYHQQYYMLLGCTEFTKVYPQIKDNPWPYVNLVKIALSLGMGENEVEELLKIANGCLPRVRLEHNRLNAELNSLKAETSHIARTYQQFVDRNIELKKREDELHKSISKLEAKKTKFNESLSQSEFQDNDTHNTNVILKAKLDEIISTSDVLIQQSSISNNHYQNEVAPSSRNLVFDIRNMFR